MGTTSNAANDTAANDTAEHMPWKQTLESSEDRAAFLAKFDTFVFDCDGVLWQGEVPIPGVADVIRGLLKQGKKIIFVTNNSTRSRDQLRQKMIKLGIPEEAVAEDDTMLSSASATALYIKKRLPKVKRAYVIGSDGLLAEMEKQGIDCIGGPSDAAKTMGGAQYDDCFDRLVLSIKEEEMFKDIGAVVCGTDIHFNYYKMSVACILVQNGAEFLSTNRDTFVMQDGYKRPGNGSLLACLQATLERDALDMGKPSKSMAEMLNSLPQVVEGRTCMVGDRLDTDIVFGKIAGLTTLLVMTGCTTPELLESLNPEKEEDAKLCPNYVTGSVGDFASELL